MTEGNLRSEGFFFCARKAAVESGLKKMGRVYRERWHDRWGCTPYDELVSHPGGVATLESHVNHGEKVDS